MVRAVIFDLDGTLLDRDRTFRRFLEGQARRFSSVLRGCPAPRYVEEMLSLDANGYEVRDEAYARVAKACGLHEGADAGLISDFEERFPDECVPMPGMHDTLVALRERGVQLGLVTNGSTIIQTRKIELLGISEFFACIVISEAFGTRKPDPAIFHHATERLGVTPTQAWYVGDNPGADIDGANRAGLVSVWMEDPFFEPPDDASHRIGRLPELLPLVELG